MTETEARATWLTAHLLGEMTLVWSESDRDGSKLLPEVLSNMEDEIRALGEMAGAVTTDDR